MKVKSAHKLKPHEDRVHDRQFVWRFIGVLAALNLLLGTLAVIAWAVQTRTQGTFGDAEMAALETRITPIGRVITDASHAPPPAIPVAANTASAAAPSAAPKAGPKSGEQTVAEVCSACHGAGVSGAPRIGDAAAWKARAKAAGGPAGLAKSAANGKGAMPPRGGRPDLSDQELKAAIETMLKRSGA
jgi:cytochrome c5